ncbi:MAG: hypothetical protein V7629_17440 [Motiliproteus sp.]
MKRLYYLTDDLESTGRISSELHQSGINDWHFHVLSKDESGLYRRHIHSATGFQSLDIIHRCEQGALLGGVTGLVLTSMLWLVDPVVFPMSITISLIILCISILFGIWVGGMVGLSHENYKIKRFHDDLELGRYLLMVDVRGHQKDVVVEIMNQHPEAKAAGEGSTITNPFKYTYGKN